MAVEHVSAVLHGLFGVGTNPKLVMMVIAEHARRGSAVAWPSVDTLAELCCMHRRKVQRAIRDLVAAGWLSIERQSRGGVGRTNLYRLNMSRLIDARRANDAAKRTVRESRNHARRCMVVPTETVHQREDNHASGASNRAVSTPKTVQPDAQEPVLNRYEPVVEPGAQARWNLIAGGHNDSDRRTKGNYTPRWDRSEQGIEAKGRELKVRAEVGESYRDYAQRLWTVINLKARGDAA